MRGIQNIVVFFFFITSLYPYNGIFFPDPKCEEYKRQYEVIEKLNTFEAYHFEKMWETDFSFAWYSSGYHNPQKMHSPYIIIFYKSRSLAYSLYREKANDKMPVIIYGGITAIMPYGDPSNLNEKLRAIIVGMGFDIE